MARLFIALWPDDALRRALRDWREACSGGVGAKPVALDRLHLTLHFLGQVPGDRIPKLRHALCVPFRPFELGFSHCQRWPGGLLVVSPDTVPAAMTDLHAALGVALQGLGLPTESRAFRPHITLARGHAGPLPPAAVPALRWKVLGFALVASGAGAGAGGGYAVLEAYARVPGHQARAGS